MLLGAMIVWWICQSESYIWLTETFVDLPRQDGLKIQRRGFSHEHKTVKYKKSTDLHSVCAASYLWRMWPIMLQASFLNCYNTVCKSRLTCGFSYPYFGIHSLIFLMFNHKRSFYLYEDAVKLFSDHLKPIAAEERRIEEEEKKAREEQERIAKQLAEGSLVQIFSASWLQIQIRVINGNNKGLILLPWWRQSNSWDTHPKKRFWNDAYHIFSQQSNITKTTLTSLQFLLLGFSAFTSAFFPP